jgi:predicted dehydrogenase
MNNNEKIRLGMIGAGNIGRVHMETFKQVAGAEITAITDVFIPGAEKAAADFGIGQVHSSAETLIQDEQIDAVIIGVPNQFHAALTIQALKAGKHVLLEKPMALNLEEARQIVKAQQEYKKIVMVAHQMRWEWPSLQVKEQIEKGALGDIYNAKAGWFRRKGIPGWGTWFTQTAQSGGGPLIDIGVHMLDLSLYLMGNPKPVSVFGSTYAEFGPKRRGIGTWGTPDWTGTYDVEDLATALIKMDNGSTLSLEVSWAVHMDTSNEPFIHLMGSEGGASMQGQKAKLLTEIYDRAVDVELTKPGKAIQERVLLSSHFIECIQENKEPISNVMTGFTNNLILDAIYESSRTGHEVILNWDI